MYRVHVDIILLLVLVVVFGYRGRRREIYSALASLSRAATIAYCEYVYRRYGRFPAASGPFRTVLAYQAHNLDREFYSKFYRPEAVGGGTSHTSP